MSSGDPVSQTNKHPLIALGCICIYAHVHTYHIHVNAYLSLLPLGARRKQRGGEELQLRLFPAQEHSLPELSCFSAHWSIFAVELVAPCQGFLPQIEFWKGLPLSSSLQTPLHISSDLSPTPFPKGNIWSIFCFSRGSPLGHT